MLAASGWPRVYQLFWIIVCTVLARPAGMDSTVGRTPSLMQRTHGPGCARSRLASWTKSFVGDFTIVTSFLFLIAASRLND
jgi:hypothetical protein